MDRRTMLERLNAGKKSGLDEEGMKALALELSIEKWEDMIAGKGVDMGWQNCALCELDGMTDKGACEGCVVYKRTGKYGCGGTPYEEFEYAENAEDDELMKEAEKKEVKFLKSFRTGKT